MRVYLIAGETSGDLHGGRLMESLLDADPETEIRFVGGREMAACALRHPGRAHMAWDCREGAVMGIGEVLLKAFSLLRTLRRCKKDLLAFRPDRVVLIDYPGFNLKMAAFAHRAGFKVCYYIAPKVWASREGRIEALKRHVDCLLIVFPFEIPYFRERGVPFTYVGNPLTQSIAAHPALSESRERFLSRTGLPADAPWIALLAGSRRMELEITNLNNTSLTLEYSLSKFLITFG